MASYEATGYRLEGRSVGNKPAVLRGRFAGRFRR